MPLPEGPFDGQIFIDFVKTKWQYDATINVWNKVGVVDDIPIVGNRNDGLISPALQEFLDSIPDRAGGFSIVAKPYMSAVPFTQEFLLDDIIYKTIETGDDIVIYTTKELAVDEYAGKLIYFLSGASNGKTILITTNSANALTIIGKPSLKNGDQFYIIDPISYNPNGFISGDIKLVSDSLKITCVNSDGEELSDSCDINQICVGKVNGSVPSVGLNFEVSDDFLESFCIEIPGCQGPKGVKGPKGDKGVNGAGDGPVGITGDAGIDAPNTPHKFSGMKVIDIDDIYDTAVVGLELDSNNNKLNVLKAKIKAPHDDKPAAKVIALPIDRTLEFDGDGFGYNIIAPPNDTYGSNDVDIVYCPNGTGISQIKGLDGVSVGSMKLSVIVNSIVDEYQKKLLIVNNKYNAQIKEYINSIDKEARQILGNLAKELSDCEFKVPMDYCLSIKPDNCCDNEGGTNPINEEVGVGVPVEIAAVPSSPHDTGGHATRQVINYVYITNNGDTNLAAGTYVVNYLSGAIWSSWRPSGLAGTATPPYGFTQYIVGTSLDGFGLEAILTYGTITQTVKFPNIDQVFAYRGDCETAYQNATTQFKSMSIVIPAGSTGQIKLYCKPVGNVTDNGTIQLECLWYK